MGGSQSKSSSTNESNVTHINKNTVDIVNKNINTAVANALIKNNASCQTVNDINQLISFRGCKIDGDINIKDVKQNAMITVDFNCVNAFKAEQEMAQAILSELTNEIGSKMDSQSINNMKALADAQSKSSGFLSVLSPSSSSSTNVNKYNLRVENTTDTNIQNIIANNITSNFEVESIQECINQTAIDQKLDFENCSVGGSLNLQEFEQKAGIASVINCVNKSGTVQDIVNKSGSELGVVVETDTISKSDSTMQSDAKSSSESKGLSLDFLGMLGCGSFFGASIWSLVICVIVILLLCFLSFGMSRDDRRSDYSNSRNYDR